MLLLSAVSLAIWIYLILFRGAFWRVRSTRDERGDTLKHAERRIIAVIPARNEAEVIGDSLRSLLKQNGPDLQIIVVDDASADGTASIATAAAAALGRSERITTITGKPLPPGWTGKLWALSQGIEKALLLGPDYLLLTDADIRHGQDSVRDLVTIAESRQYDLASFMVRLACRSWAEKALIPAFVFFFFQLYPPAWIGSERRKTAGAAGGSILIRPEALAKVGGLAAIKGEVIDDCALPRAVKRSGGRIWMGLTADTSSIRSYGSFGEIGRMIARTAFSQLRHSAITLLGTVLALFLTYLAPVVSLLSGVRASVALGLCAWLLMSICYWPMLRFYRRSPLWCCALPLITAFYGFVTVESAVRYWSGRGGEWKNRLQDTRR